MKRFVVVLCVSLGAIWVVPMLHRGSTFAAEPVKEKGLIAYWNFDEGKGDVAKDVSGNGNNATVNGAEWTKGKIGGALSFEEGSSVEVPTEKLELKDAVTLEAWFMLQDIENYRYIINWWGSYLLRTDGPKEGNKLSFFVFLGGTPEPRVSADPPEVNKWYHAVALWDGSKIQIWVNGEKKGEKERAGSPAVTEKPFTIGSNFVGIIDEVKIYNRALTEAEIKAHYEAGSKK